MKFNDSFSLLLIILAVHISFGFIFKPQYLHTNPRVTAMTDFDFKGLKSKTEEKMGKTLAALVSQYQGLRVNGISPDSLEKIAVNCGGNTVPLSTVASVRQISPGCLLVDVFLNEYRKQTEAAITQAGVGLTVSPDPSSAALRVTVRISL